MTRSNSGEMCPDDCRPDRRGRRDAANLLLHDAEAALGTLSASDSGSSGPFGASWGASASFSGGTVTLMAPDTVSIDNLDISYSLSLTLSIDLSFLDFCIPQICISTPFGDLCTPKICFSFPTISVPISFASSAFCPPTSASTST